MNDKVKELVEWAERQIAPCLAYPMGSVQTQAEGIVSRVLSHPDLALIDREKFARHILVRTYNPGWYPVIPLAEAIKEKGEMNPKCPHLKTSRAYDDQFDEVYEGSICTLADKHCLMEAGEECKIYNQWLEEQT